MNKLKQKKQHNTNRNRDNAEARGLTVLLPHSLWTTLVNLAPTTGVIAGGLGASLPARPAVGAILHPDNTKENEQMRSQQTWSWEYQKTWYRIQSGPDN